MASTTLTPMQKPPQDLLPQWGLRLEARWHWLKVTRQGEPLTPLESNHRKPYEVLLLARASGAAATAAADIRPVPSDCVLITTTTVFHSEKPPLLHLLQPHLPASSGPLWQTCLDIFGRRPRPGVTTLGNEAIKLVATPLHHL
jgi:N6-adenosine-specific RNA methylase IME4